MLDPDRSRTARKITWLSFAQFVKYTGWTEKKYLPLLQALVDLYFK